MDIGTQIRKVREFKDLSQRYVASKLGMSQNNYSKIEKGERNLKMSRLYQIAEILEVDFLDIVTLNESKFLQRGSNPNFNSFIEFDFVGKIIKELHDQYEHRIDRLESEVEFLRSLLKKQ